VFFFLSLPGGHITASYPVGDHCSDQTVRLVGAFLHTLVGNVCFYNYKDINYVRIFRSTQELTYKIYLKEELFYVPQREFFGR